ncbi:MAG: ribosomal-protein-alanine N-acetyltransferase [Paracoccaceae bacterium]|jgi:ribosomal-protein-alanine N-acetyltransferase
MDDLLRDGGAAAAPIAATIHAAAFAPRERSWTTDEFASLADLPGSFLLLAAAHSQPDGGLLLGRARGDEAELLTIGVAPSARRAGLARALLAGFARHAAARGATTAFLEVAEDNAAARALYLSAGWIDVGRRKGYVRRQDGGRVDAHVMQRDLARDQG